MLLETEKIRLRAVEPEDLDVLYRWENNPAYWHAGEVRAPYSKYLLKQYILSASKDIYENKQLRFIIELKESNTPVGTIDLFDFDVFNSRIGVGLLIDKPFQNQGYVSMSLTIIKEYVFSYLNIHQLYAHVAVKNTNSIKLFEKNGFNKTCVLKEWLLIDTIFTDAVLFQHLKPLKGLSVSKM